MSEDAQPTEEQESGDAVVPGYLLNAFTNIRFAPVPEPHVSSWQVEEVIATLDDGTEKKLFFVVETRMRGNDISVYWYDMAKLQEFVQAAMMSAQRLQMAEQTHSPLLVASEAQMQQVVEQAQNAGVLHIPGR